MKILVANLGSTSFKFRLFDMDSEAQLARGGVERIGSEQSSTFVEVGTDRRESAISAPDHTVAVRECLKHLTAPDFGCLQSTAEVSAIGFKAVHGGRAGGVVSVDENVLSAMEEMAQVAPAHNPPYVAAMRQMADRLPEIPLVAAFETAFHESIPARLKHYAVPVEWARDWGIQRWGFHGASHRYVAGRCAQLTEKSDLRIISCHLGGSSSVCAIRDGKSVATSMGMSPQSGLPQNNRVGDFDPFALPVILARTGKTLDDVLEILAEQCGLLGLSGTSGDIRDIGRAAQEGDKRAQLALDVYVSSTRHYLGAYLVELGGVDVIAFTGGIGENRPEIRAAVLAELEELGIAIDPERNQQASGESFVHSEASRAQIVIVPTNEELIVARQTKEFLENN